ncbi:uncharacterized protein LOC134534469 [Bacillus rossius redtenbacheri]|uniref:uncharacterized protein LOC134534469 n=1 Tax=Bacillus rossius redtenbacheri TaxID=93214 RepID=UPI002FDEF92A
MTGPRSWRALMALLALVAPGSADRAEESLDREVDRHDLSPGRLLLGRVVDALVPGDPGADNDLWRGLMGECARDASFACVRRGVFGYLDRSLDEGARDLRVYDGLVLARNENKYSEELNSNGTAEARSAPDSFEGVAEALYDKGVRFAMTHDVRLQLPRFLFGGAVLRVSPRALDGEGGALLKVEVNPDGARADEGRIFFKKHKEFKKKLLMSFMALLLVIKMIKVKLIYLLPLLIGVGAAKKLLLKVLLFIFPAFSHLFKFCSTYHSSYSGKYHHHHHKIAHHHHHVKVPVPVPVPVPSHHDEGYPPSGHASWDSGPGWDSPSGPGLDHAGSRSELAAAGHRAEQELASWGLGHSQGDPADTFSANYGDSLAYQAHLPEDPRPVYVTPGPPQRKAYTAQRHDLRQQVQSLEAQLQRQTQVQQKLQNLRVPQAQALTALPAPAAGGSTVAVTYDPFYSPILRRLDDVFVQLGLSDEPCRQRLVCSMYRWPARFSPHSNLVSAELSRDPSELQKPSSPNSAVVRFYRYVQAARDGQEQKNCLSLYPACTVNTEMWRQ